MSMSDTADNPTEPSSASSSSSYENNTKNTSNDNNDNFFDKLAACLPPTMADMTASDKSFEHEKPSIDSNTNKIDQASAEPESLNNVLEQFKNFHETLITEKFDGFKTQKSELELLKEKIMKLEERNNELEKKLNTNVNSKDNSLNDSFSLATTAVATGDLSQQPKVVDIPDKPTPALDNIIYNPTTTPKYAPAPNVLQQAPSSLRNIPNINQGGFIITSNGSIAYVPPGSANSGSFSSSTPKQVASSSFTASSSNAHSNFDPGSINLETSDQPQLDAKSINLDMSSFLSKNIFNVYTPVKQQVVASPVTSPKAKGKTTEQPTAFILSSSGQLVPISQSNQQQTSSAPFILPKPATQIAPKPKQKPVKPPKLAKKQTQSKPEPVKIDPVATQPTPQTDQSTFKHRAIRPKPSSTPQFTTQHKPIIPKPPQVTQTPSTPAPVLQITTGQMQQPLLVLPNTITSPNKQNYGIIKINTVSPKQDPNSTKMANLNSKIMLEANDILSKAASMIFSPSEFALNNLSPNTNASNVATSPTNAQIIYANTTENATADNIPAAAPIAPAGKIAIQRNNSQQNILPKKAISRSLVPKATSQDNLTQKPTPKVPIKKNQPHTLLKKVASSSGSSKDDSTKRSKASLAPKTKSDTGMDIEKVLDSISTPAADEAATQKQQEQFDMQIQLQLQSILNGTAPAQKSETPSPLKQLVSGSSGNVESMPSLDDFFGFEALESSKAPAIKPSTPKSKNTKMLKPKPAASKQVSPVKATTSPKSKNVQIRPKPDSKMAKKQQQTTKLELGEELDNVLEQVESITTLTSITQTVAASITTSTTPTATQGSHDETNKSNNDFLFDLLNIETASQGGNGNCAQNSNNNNNTSFESQNDGKVNNKKANLLKKIDKSTSVLSTPPSLQTKPSNKKPLNNTNKQNKTTPIKATPSLATNAAAASLTLDDPDFFSFLKEPSTIDELKRTPLKPDNHNNDQSMAKKRGRPPKPLKQQQQQDEHITDPDLDPSKKHCQSDENSNSKCILSTAVQNTFHDLINSNFTDKQRDKSTESATHNTSTNNKENADVNDSEASAAAVANEPAVDFNVYDIAMNENTHVDDQQQADVTIASLMCPIRNRKRTRVAAVKPDSLEAGGKKSSVKSSAEKCENKALSANEACDDVKRRKKSVEFDVPIMFDNCEQSGEAIDTTKPNEPSKQDSIPTTSTIDSLLPTSANEKRKRGRPAKAAAAVPNNLTPPPTTTPTVPETETKAPNYKKINNPCGTTSLLALNTPPTNIEYAGLTRFEIPFETDEEINAKSTPPPTQTDSTKKSAAAELVDPKPTIEDKDEPISLESIQKTIMDFTNSEPIITKEKPEDKEPESSNESTKTLNQPEKKDTHIYNKPSEEIIKSAHMSHYDLENDPIINKDLRQLHNTTDSSSHIKPPHFSHTTSSIVTPPSTVCSVPSSVSSTASTSTTPHFQTALSINPSSTSSTASSTQMISPVSNTDHFNQQPQQPAQHQYYQYYQQNQFNQSASYPPKPTTPVKYSTNSSYTAAAAADPPLNTSNLDTSTSSITHQHQHNQSPNLLYKSTSSSNLAAAPAVTAPICKTPIHLNTSQSSPQHRHSMSLCSTPTPTTPQPPNNNTYTNGNISPLAAVSKIPPPAALYQQQQQQQPHSTVYQNQNPFTQSFPLLPNYNTTQYHNQTTHQYPQHQYPQQQLQQHHQIQQKPPTQYDQTPSYLPTPAPQSTPQTYYQQAPNNRPNNTTYLPTYSTATTTSSEPKPKPKKSIKSKSKTSKSVQQPPAAPQHHQQYPIPHQPHQNYDKLMSVNAATALHAAANWYDFTSQVSKGSSSEAAAIASLSNFFQKQQADNAPAAPVTSQWPNSQPQNQTSNQYHQQSSLNSLFAPSSHKQPKPDTHLPPNRHHSHQSSSYQPQSHYQQQNVQQYQKQNIPMPRAGSSSNLTDSVYSRQQPGNHGNHDTQPHNSYYQPSIHHQQSTHQHQSGQQAPNSSQFSYQSQFSQQAAANMRHSTAQHNHLAAPNPALAFPPHHAVAMNNLLANQFSSVPQFNWHPKI